MVIPCPDACDSDGCVDVDLFLVNYINVECIFARRQYTTLLLIIEEKELRLVLHVQLEVVKLHNLFLQ